MTIARRASALRRGLMLQAAEREARRGGIDAALARLAKAATDKDIETRRAALEAAARLAAAHGRGEESAEHLRNVVRLDGGDAAAWAALAQRLEEIGELAEAVYGWRRVIEAGGEDAGIRLRIAGLVDRYGDKAAQIEAWREALAAAPQAALPHHRLADLLQWDAPAQALPHLERLAELEPGEAISRRIVAVAERLGDLKPVLPHVRRLAELDGAAAGFRRLALLLIELGDLDGAQAAWGSVLKRENEALDAHLWLADRFEASDPAKAAPHLRAAAKRTRTDPVLWKRAAKASAEIPNDEAAASAWKVASDLAPGDMEAARAAGGALFKIGRNDEAAAVMRRFTRLHPTDTKIRRSLLGLAQRWKDVDLQIELMTELAALAETPAEFQAPLATLLRAQGRLAEAVPILAALAAAQPQSAPAQQAYAEALEACDHPAKAVDAWRAVVALRPDDAKLHAHLATLLDRLDRRGEAMSHMRRLAETLANDRKAWSRLAGRARLLGDAEIERQALENLLRLTPDDAAGRKRLVELLLAAKRRPDALPHVEALTQAAPDDAWAWATLAELRAAGDDKAATIAALRRLTALDPAAVGAHERLARLLDAEGDRVGAVEPLRALAAATPNEPKAWRRLALRLLELGDAEAAIAPLETLTVLEPNDLSHADRLAEALLAAGRAEEAVPHAWRLARAFPKNYDRWRKLGGVLEGLGRTEEAIEAWRPVSAAAPDDLPAHEALARLYEAAGRSEEALKHLRVVAAARPNDLSVLRRLVALQAERGSTDDLLPALERLHGAKPKDVPTLRRLASARGKAGDAEGALTALRALEALRPNDVDVQAQLALVLADQKAIEPALAAWRAVLAKRPNDLEAHRRVAALLYGERRRQEALPHLRAIVAEDRSDLRAWRRIASIVADDGDAAAQVAAWGDVVAVDPDDAGAHEQLVELLEGADLQAALPHMEAVARLTPDKVKPWKRFGKWLQDEGRTEEAIAAWSQSLAIAPDDVETHRRLAQLHLLSGDYRAGLRRLNSFAMINEEAPPALAALVPDPPALTHTPLVSAVILSLEGAELLESLFSSFHATNRYPAVELIVIDHASTDDTAAVLDRWQDRLPIRRIMRDDNYSYSASCNLGVREAKGELVLLLNNDVVFHEDVLGEMVRHLTPDVGIVGLKQYNSAPLPEEVLRPYHIGVRFAWDAGGQWFRPRHAIPTPSDQLIGLKPAYFPAVTASVMLCRRDDYLAVGGLDEAFIYGHEDLDLCCRMRFDHGKAIVSLNSRSAFHPKNSTRRGADAETRARQGAANEALFRQRWADRIAAEYRERLFSDDGSYRGRAPTVAFGLRAEADDALTARTYAVGEAMAARFGWTVRYLLDDEPGWSNGEGVDAVLGMGDFPVDKVKTREPFVVRRTVDDDGRPPEALAQALREALEAGG